MKRPVVQAVVLVLLSTVVAVVANAVAGRDRRLVLPGYYPEALNVPRAAAPPPPAAVTPSPEPAPPTVVATTTEQSSGPGQPAMEITTTTVAPPASRPVVPPPAVPLTQRFPPHPDKAYVEIGYDDVALLHSRGALFLDARRTSVFESGHIAGARPFSVWEADVDDKVNGLFEERGDPEEQNQPIVIYCSGGACEDSHMLAQKLWGVQFNNVYVYKDGYPDWVSRGGATRKGATP